MKDNKGIVIGFCVAVFATLSGVYLYVELFSKYDFLTTYQMIVDGDLHAQILTLGAVPNIFVFLVFLKKNQELRAKGVLLATICVALLTVYLKFI